MIQQQNLAAQALLRTLTSLSTGSTPRTQCHNPPTNTDKAKPLSITIFYAQKVLLQLKQFTLQFCYVISL
jgi:hypothetical protein